MVAKINDEVYILSIVKVYSYLSFFFLRCAKEGRVFENIESDVATLKVLG